MCKYIEALEAVLEVEEEERIYEDWKKSQNLFSVFWE